jgi:hypothetical protein
MPRDADVYVRKELKIREREIDVRHVGRAWYLSTTATTARQTRDGMEKD